MRDGTNYPWKMVRKETTGRSRERSCLLKKRRIRNVFVDEVLHLIHKQISTSECILRQQIARDRKDEPIFPDVLLLLDRWLKTSIWNSLDGGSGTSERPEAFLICAMA